MPASTTLRGTVVYFVAAPDVGRVKIGLSKGLKNRLNNLRLSSPVPLELLRTIPGGRGVERYLHMCFAAHHTHGEWFHLAEPIKNMVESGEMPVASEAMIAELGEEAAHRLTRFARIESAVADGADTPERVCFALDIEPEQMEDDVRAMVAAGYLRSYDSSVPHAATLAKLQRQAQEEDERITQVREEIERAAEVVETIKANTTPEQRLQILQRANELSRAA